MLSSRDKSSTWPSIWLPLKTKSTRPMPMSNKEFQIENSMLLNWNSKTTNTLKRLKSTPI
jgi:hypothetical protein